MSYFNWLRQGSELHIAEQTADGLKLRAAKKDKATREQFHIIVARAIHELPGEGYDVRTHKSSRGSFYDFAVITKAAPPRISTGGGNVTVRSSGGSNAGRGRMTG